MPDKELMTYDDLIDLLREDINHKLVGRRLQAGDTYSLPMDFVAQVLLLGIYDRLGEIEDQLGGIGRNMWDK